MAKRSSSSTNGCLWLFLILILAGWAISLVETLAPFLLAAGLGFLGYRVIKKKKARQAIASAELRLEQLKEDVRQADQDVTKLNILLDQQKNDQYRSLAQRILPKIKHIEAETTALKAHMEAHTYERVKQRARDTYRLISEQLARLEVADTPHPLTTEEQIHSSAPEIEQTYYNIQRDHQTILDKISKADNKEELLALHQASMERFDDILDGYLKIKASPKDYYKADERLQEAKAALEQFDLDLDETLRQLNESDMKDFDVSLRIMKDKR